MRSKRWDGKSGCAVEVTLSVMGGVWKPIILFHLMTGKRRFMELTRRVPNATQSMLTSQLRELEADGVVIRHVYPEVPPKVEYELSEFGRTLVPVLLAMREWGETYRGHGSTEGDCQR
jgi:DNA-binding HxlR family transcriptional regulator